MSFPLLSNFQKEDYISNCETRMTTVATLKQQKRDVLEYLIAQIKGEKPPSLLPKPTPTSQPTV